MIREDDCLATIVEAVRVRHSGVGTRANKATGEITYRLVLSLCTRIRLSFIVHPISRFTTLAI